MISSLPAVHGDVAPRFEAVREAFGENLRHRGEGGAACCVWLDGSKVVDVWGGVRDASTGAFWEEDTMVLVYSATKGLAAMALALAHSHGWLDFDECVCAYWPEFAQQGKQDITVRQLLAHQAGLFALDVPLNRAAVADPERLDALLARQRPAWPPGDRVAYHAITLGFYEGALLRRIDPAGRTLGHFFQDEIATPLGLDCYVRVPADLPNSRIALLESAGWWRMLAGLPPRLALASLNPRSNFRRALAGSDLPHDPERIVARELEVPSGGGVGTARSIAQAYGLFAQGGGALGLRPATLAALCAPATPSRHGFYDECMLGEAAYSLGFMKPSAAWPFGSPFAFGAPGAGGALGFADPETGIGYAYVTNQMGAKITPDPREAALRDALQSCLRCSPASELRRRP